MTTNADRNLETRRALLRRWIPQEERQSVTRGVNHIAVFARDLEATAAFYTDVLGMPVINVTANRDVPESTHMNVDVGGGVMLSFFDFPHVPRLRRRAPEGVGGIMHLAIAIPPYRLAEVRKSLGDNRVDFQEISGSLYFKDPNGLGIELLPVG
ncbi:MAG: VOC family protein [Dehalococcoidia bacterium]